MFLYYLKMRNGLGWTCRKTITEKPHTNHTKLDIMWKTIDYVREKKHGEH